MIPAKNNIKPTAKPTSNRTLNTILNNFMKNILPLFLFFYREDIYFKISHILFRSKQSKITIMIRKAMWCLVMMMLILTGSPNKTILADPVMENHIVIKIQTGKRELLKDGELVLTMQTPPFLFRGKTFLSCSALAGVLGWKVTFLQDNQSLELVDKAGNLIQLKADELTLRYNYTPIKLDEKDGKIKVLQISRELFVPVRMFASILGAVSFSWDQVNQMFSMYFPVIPVTTSPETYFGGNWPCLKGNSMRSGWIIDECAPSGLQLEKKWMFLSEGWITTSPIVVDSIVYIGDREGNLTALEEKTGHIIWTRDFQDRIFSTPVVSGDSLFVGTWDHAFYCLNRFTGEIVWDKPIDSLINSSPLVWNQSVLFGSDRGVFYCLNTKDGQELWTYLARDEIASSPCTDGDRVFFGCRDMSLYALNLSTGEYLWRYQTEGCTYATPSTDGELVFQGSQDHKVYAFDEQTGTVRWSFQTGSGIYSSPSYTSDFLYVGSQDTCLYSIRKETGAPVWTYQTNGAVSSSPVLSGNRLFIGSGDGNLYCLNALSGRLIQKIELSEPITQTCAISKGILYTASGPALYAFGSAH